MTSSPPRSDGLPQFNAGTVLLLVVAALGAGWAVGLIRPRYEEGVLHLHVWRGRRLASFDFRDSWLLLSIVLVMGWSVATTVEHSAWVPDTDGKLVPALALAAVLGWLFATAGATRLAYLLLSIPTMVIGALLFSGSPLTTRGGIPALRRWLLDLPAQTNELLVICLVVMCLLTGLWTSWWVFRRRNGLVALLPTGTILAVEIINDVSASVTFFTLVWLAAAAAVLLRINFVALKGEWRKRRLPHASDTGWTFGEVGVEATVAILAVSFILVPPLTSTDISAALLPGSLHSDSLLHPFGIGSGGSGHGSIGSIGYSEIVRPGSQLKAKSETVMVVTGDTPSLYPYWRGIALGGWDGIQWYELPSTSEVPVRQQPLLLPGANVPRDDFPSDPQRLIVIQNTFRIAVPFEQTKGAVFSAGELVAVRNQPTSIRGIMTSVPAPGAGSAPGLVNVPGDNADIASFDTIDHVRLVRQLQPPYSYTVSEAIPNVDVADLRSAGTTYPNWVSPYINLYYDGRTAAGYSPARDAEIAALAHDVVTAAGATTPYDQAKAIEHWFISGNRFTYTLTPPPAPVGVRPLDYFLFTSHRGFCQDFSTAMNVMLRTLGIPSRQMSGFGLGTFDEKTHQYSVNSLDAHSWVEVYFPGYGWIPFEPTPDGINSPINRPATRAQLNLPLPATTAPTSRPRDRQLEPSPDTSGSAGTTPFPDVWRPLLTVGGIVILAILLCLLIAARWLLGVKDLPRIWRRLLFLGDRLKVRRHAGDTPTEFGGRLAGSVPELDAELRRLAELYTRASFRRGGLRADELAEAKQAWARVRRRYAGLVAGAWGDALRNGRVVSEEEAAASESREPSPRR